MSDSVCGNCAAPLYGPYCASCGQHQHASAQPLWALLHDAWHDLTHLDGRILTTLRRLIARPGDLTREYLAGRRARYAPPFRLYLVISIVFFALQSLTAHEANERLVSADGGKDNCEVLVLGSPSLTRVLRDVCRKVTADGGTSAKQAFHANLPRMMFFFLPLVAAVMLLLYWKPRRFFIEHLVLVLHNHAALFTLLMGEALLSWLERSLPATASVVGVAQTLLGAYAIYYVYRAMRVVYGQSRRRTLLKMVPLGLAYGFFLAITAGLTFVLGAALT